MLWKLLTLVIVTTFATNPEQQPQVQTLYWMIGHWERDNNTAERQSYEIWTKAEDGSLEGFGYTLKNGDTTFTEKLEIVEKAGQLIFVANVSQNKELTFFKITTITDSLFICENMLHDFPKKIAYRRDGENLYAQIFDDKNRVDYAFKLEE